MFQKMYHEDAAMEFLRNNWLAIISLLVALIGGVPGVIAVINQRKNRPIFRFDLVNVITGEMPKKPSGDVHTMILLTGTASNEGNSVLSPAYFELECKVDGTWIKFEKTLIPEDAQFQSDVQDIQLASAWRRDLQRFSSTVTRGMPLNGHLMFISPNVPLVKVRNKPDLQLKLTCWDIFGKEHVTPIVLSSNAIGAGAMYPKHGLKITPRT